ncbi:MAG: alpha/beta hydrolase [Lewinellaceae bacterium]|nr:alpha/beta hydrolase [Saprospiraceae bacterium]MCB9341720.1 alpha/beta hydrolase [Lewinellaceae bacterium]
MIWIIFITIIIAFAGVGIHGYLNGVMAPPYDPEKMMLNYERIGNGPKKMVLLHGLTGSSKYWKTGLGDLPDSCSILLIDLLGFGDSPKPNSKYDLEEHLGAIEKVIKREGFDTGEAVVVGHSLGAILTIGLVGKHPDWFQSLAVIGLPNYSGKEAIKTKFGKASLWDGVSVDSRYKFVCFFHPLYMTEWFRPKNIPKDIFKDAGKHTWVSYYRTLDEVIINTDLRELASRIKDKKILFIHGENDAAAPIENVEALLPISTNAKFERLPDADHHVFLTDPAKVWALIEPLFSIDKKLEPVK